MLTYRVLFAIALFLLEATAAGCGRGISFHALLNTEQHSQPANEFDLAAPGPGELAWAGNPTPAAASVKDGFGVLAVDFNTKQVDQAGTSFAAPFVASGAGLLWSYRPELTAAEVRSALEFHGGAAHNFARGIKRVDLYLALASVATPAKIPALDGVDPSGPAQRGELLGDTTLPVSLLNPENVTLARYYLDLAPVGTAGPEDILRVGNAAEPDFPAQFDVSGLANCRAMLHVELTSSTGNEVQADYGPVWICNRHGDIDGDGQIGDGDLTALKSLIGLTASDSGFVPFADSDSDGTITEADAAVIGYTYGQ